MSSENTQLVAEFFSAFGRGDIAGILETLHDDVTIIAEGPSTVPWYGTYQGKAGAEAFLSALGSNVEPQQFEVRTLASEGSIVVAVGYLAHRIPSTGRQFASDWALLCSVEEGRIVRYQFFENTAAAVEAFRPVVALV